MRFMYFIILFLLVCNLLIIIMSGLTGVNIYEKYGKQILTVSLQFLLFLVAFYVAMLIAGLSSY